MRVLIAGLEIPFPAVGGGRTRTYHLLRALAARHELTLVGFTYGEEPDRASFPVRVIGVPWEWPPLYREMTEGDSRTAPEAAARLAQETEEPWCASVLESARMAETLGRCAKDGVDLVLIEHSDMGRFLESLPPSVPAVMDFHDVYTRMALRAVERAPAEERVAARREADRVRRFETRVARQCALCLTCSEVEASGVRTLLGVDRVRVVPNGVDASFFTGGDAPPTGGSLLFTGTMDYEPNVEAVQYFCAKVLPRIRQEIPAATLHVVGTNPADEVRRLASESVVVHGRVPDLRPFYREAEVVVVPLLQGGGTRLKVLEAAASGKAIVTTAVGVEGLEFRPGEDLLVAETAEDFASAVVALHDDAELREELGRRARERARPYDWESIGDRFGALIESLA
jgi:glycosyltransferase involved in cell wall biosynthesis